MNLLPVIVRAVSVLMLMGANGFGQVVVHADGSAGHPSAMLDVNSPGKGLLPPRMSCSDVNAIVSPSPGLIVFCTDCGPGSSGSLVISLNGAWFLLSAACVVPGCPASGFHPLTPDQITWTWQAVPSAAGYRWNTVNDYATATNMGTSTVKTETGLLCNTSYNRFVWAYNACGNSVPLPLTQTTAPCSFLCGSILTVNHTAGVVAPVDKTVSYGTVNNVPGDPAKCWITRNLGASQQAASVNDIQEASAGWYWQYNRKQGYKHDGSTRTPASSWINPIADTTDWFPVNDPCSIELGTGWRLPTLTEWINVKTAGNWTNWNGPWSSPLKMHGAGYLFNTNGNLVSRGSRGDYWSSTIHVPSFGMYLDMHSGYVGTSSSNMSYAYTLRCLRE